MFSIKVADTQSHIRHDYWQ